jgi:hypothetical protein
MAQARDALLLSFAEVFGCALVDEDGAPLDA